MEPLAGNTAGASNPDPVSTNQERIATLAKQSPGMALLTCVSFSSIEYAAAWGFRHGRSHNLRSRMR